MSLDPDFIEKLSGTLGNVLKNHLEAEQSPSSGNDMGLDVFINDFEDEFPRDPDDPALGSYPTYSEEANRAAKEEPYGLKRGDRPKVWELNQPPPSRVRGWRVVDLYPNREIKSEFYRLAGTPSEIRMMAQLIRHIQELVKKFGSGSINFEEWFKQWADGWESLTNRSNPALNLTTNYPALDSAKVDPATGTSTTIERWRTPTTKPGYIEWKDPLGKGVDGYKVIEYFPSKNDATTSVIFSGSDTDIINHIIRHHSSAQGEGDSGFNRITPRTTGHPSVHFYFYSQDRSTNRVYRGEYRYSLSNIVEFQELAVNGESIISKSDIRQLADRIEQQFLPNINSPYAIKKGREIFTYHQWNRGYYMWTPARNKESAVELFTKILATRPDTFDDRWMRKSEAVNVSKTYPATKPKVNVLNRDVELEEKHPLVEVPFRYAWIELPVTGMRHILVSRSTRHQRSPEIFID